MLHSFVQGVVSVKKMVEVLSEHVIPYYTTRTHVHDRLLAHPVAADPSDARALPLLEHQSAVQLARLGEDVLKSAATSDGRIFYCRRRLLGGQRLSASKAARTFVFDGFIEYMKLCMEKAAKARESDLKSKAPDAARTADLPWRTHIINTAP